MTLNKTALVAIAVSSLLIAAPAFAQSAGTSLTGTSNGMQGTPGQPSASKSAGTTVKPGTPLPNGDMTGRSSGPSTGTGSAAGTATGGPVGGNPSRN